MGIQRLAEIFNIGDYQTNNTRSGDDTMTGAEWPPPDQVERIAGYERYAALWRGDHFAAHKPNVSGEYISVNIPKVIVTIPADLLFGEDLSLVYPDDIQDADKERIEAIWERNEVQSLLYENALDTGYTGDGVWSVGLAVKDGAEVGEATIKTHPAETWFPETDPDDVRIILRHRLAWVRTVKAGGKSVEYLRVIIHERGKVLHELYRTEKGKILRPANEAEWDTLYETRPDEEQVGVAGEFLVEHIPNFRTARQLFGQSEYVGLEDLFSALDARMTQVDGILDRHSDPIIELPWDLWMKLTDGGKQAVDKENLEVVAKDDNGNGVSYVVWDGKLSDNMVFIDQLMAQIAIVSETAPQLLGREGWGTVSGRALKILLLRTLAKVARKRRYYSSVIPRLLSKAQQLEGVADPVLVRVEWPDGLPADVLEEIEEMDRRIANRTISRKGAVKQMDGLNDTEADAVLAEIDDDDQSEVGAVAQGMAGRTLPTIKVNAGLGEAE